MGGAVVQAVDDSWRLVRTYEEATLNINDMMQGGAGWRPPPPGSDEWVEQLQKSLVSSVLLAVPVEDKPLDPQFVFDVCSGYFILVGQMQKCKCFKGPAPCGSSCECGCLWCSLLAHHGGFDDDDEAGGRGTLLE